VLLAGVCRRRRLQRFLNVIINYLNFTIMTSDECCSAVTWVQQEIPGLVVLEFPVHECFYQGYEYAQLLQIVLDNFRNVIDSKV